jgi:peptidoglycan/xylan/chitin deacetylase (PgdA/CDA1 family)
MNKNIFNIVSKKIDDFQLYDTYSKFRRIYKGHQVLILMYHRIGIQKNNFFFNVTEPTVFEEQIKYLLNDQNFHFVSLKKLIECIKSNDLTKKLVVISLDDGYKDNYKYAYPILKKYNIPAIIYVTTGNINSRELFWWDKVGYIIKHSSLAQIDINPFGSLPIGTNGQKIIAYKKITQDLKKVSNDSKNQIIKTLQKKSKLTIPKDKKNEVLLTWKEIKIMANNGIDFGAHSVTHPILTKLPLKKAKFEIEKSKEDIESNINNKKIYSFSYPNGNFNNKIIKILKENNFDCAVTNNPGIITKNDNLYTLKRIQISKEFSKLHNLKLMISGLGCDIQNFIKIKI